MARPMSYRHRVAIMEPVGVQDATTGEIVVYWQPLSLTSEIALDSVPADVLTGPGREFREAGAVRSEVVLRVSFRWFEGLLPTHRIEWEGLGYDIYSIERDPTGRLFYRVACRGSGVVLDAPPTPPVDIGYPLDDDGTLASQFGFGHAATNAPDYLRADYTFISPNTGNAAYAIPSEAEAFTSQAIVVGAGKILAFEWVVHSVPSGGSSQLSVGGISFTSESGVPTGAGFVAAVRRSGSNNYFYHDNIVGQPAVITPAGLRIGVEFNGDTGTIRFMNSEGYNQEVAGLFTPGQAVSFGIVFDDNGVTPAGNTAGVEAIPSAAGMTLPFTAGAVDVFGNLV